MLPNEIEAGVTLDHLTEVAGYPASDGWTLSFHLRGAGVINLTATPEGDLYRVQVDAAASGNWTAGRYTWAARISNVGGVVHAVGRGQVTILPNIAAQVAGYDGRSQARKAYEDAVAARAAYAAGGNAGVVEYQIGERRMKFKNPAELQALIDQLAREVLSEQRAEALAKGLPDPRNVYVRAARV